MTNLAAALVFAGFIGIALSLMRWAGAPPRAAVHRLLAYVLVVSFGAGLAQRDLWPFAAWPLVAGRVSDVVTHPRLVAVDGAGTEHDVDPRAWYPIAYLELNSFVNRVLPDLNPASRDSVGRWLLARANRARDRVAAGEPIEGFDRILGPLTAPFFILSPRRWTSPATTPPDRLVGLRLYRESWDPEGRARGLTITSRQLVFEYREAP